MSPGSGLQELRQPQVLLGLCQNLRAALATLDTAGGTRLVAAADASLQAAATWQLSWQAARPQASGPHTLLAAVGAWFADRLLLDGAGRGVGYSEARQAC